MPNQPCAHGQWEAHCRHDIPGGVRLCGWFRCRKCGAIRDVHTGATLPPMQKGA
jgi:hypothetical protein